MGAGDSRGYTVSQTYTTGGIAYTAPVAHSQIVDGQTNVSASITLTATDSNSPPQTLSFAIWSIPRNGTLKLSNGTTVTANHNYTVVIGGTLTYIPNPGYYGDDSFTFVACNEFACSSPVAVSILLIPLAPTAIADNYEFYAPTSLNLTGTDHNTPVLPLTFILTSLPTHGTLSGTLPNLTYTPGATLASDSFQFVVSNGGTTSLSATISLTLGSSDE